MAISTVPLDQITEADLRRLVDNGVPEGRDLEFKRDAFGSDDAAKREFLKDVSALANTAGGDLIIGVGEDDGVAKTLHGISARPADDEIRRLEAILQDGLEPRLIGARMRAVPIAAGGYALVIRLQRSWNAPHRVVFQRTNRFYGRNAGGAYEFGVEQLRAAFLGVAETERRLTDFRLDRLARFKGGVGASLIATGKLILHIAPLQPPALAINLREAAATNAGFRPMGSTRWDSTANFDGVLLMGGGGADIGGFSSLVQVFRDGRVEAGLGEMVFDMGGRGISRALAHTYALPQLIEAIPRFVGGLARLGVSPPFATMVSLIDVGGSVMTEDRWRYRQRQRLDRDDLLFEPVIIETAEFGDGWQRVLRPILDTWWNAFGWERCFDLFDEAGNWTGYPQAWRFAG